MTIKVTENPNKDLVKEVRERIAKNQGHCACAIVFDDDNKCMCKEFREQINNRIVGECGCGLYIFAIEE